MRSLLSNRYNNKRRDFYERYEAARELHPSLPPYERPAEPAELQVFNPNTTQRRHLSYRQLAKLTQEQLDNDTWLSSSQLSIAVRRGIEGRNHKVLMPRYNPEKATHEFSHNGRARRGRPPTAATVAKFASDFAVQVGGIRPPAPADDDSSSSSSSEEDFEVVESPKESEDTDSEGPESKAAVTRKRSKKNSKNSNSNASQNVTQNINQNVNQNIGQFISQYNSQIASHNVSFNQTFNQNFSQNWNTNSFHIQHSSQSQVFYRYSDDDEDYNPFGGAPHQPSFRSFICPIESCKQNFELRRTLYKHQREAGHHNWSHKCAKCGQVFRTAGFKRMHSPRACERNLLKFRISKPNEVKQLGQRTMPE
ncbi:uncharacterized protein LOC119556581 [Drosophila subpulchrella]|uniref:uncharacterized protein LOC119556581 n=1 Tax=Drosophila subpulchrella TaxID=1486046 RepID=UPI0018A19F41|nr:uncharacterized protein LOC119556581 [Drosophila subpulchrella]